MGKTKKKILFIGGGIVLFFVFVFIVAVLIFFLDKPLVKNILQSYVSKKSGMKLEIGKLDYALFPLRIEANSVKGALNSEMLDVDIALDRIYMKGNLRQALKREKPFLEVVELEHVFIHIYQKSTKKSDFKKTLPLRSELLNYAAEAKIKNVSFSLDSPTQKISISSANLNVSKTDEEGEHRFGFTGTRVDYQNNGSDTSFGCGLDAKGTFAFSDIFALEGDFSFSQLEATLSGKKAAFDSLDLTIKGEFEQDGKVVSLSRFEVKIPSLLESSGTGRAEFAQGISLSMSSDIFVKDIEKSLDFINPFLPLKIEGLNLRGQAELRGKWSIFSTAAGREADFSGTMKLLHARVDYKSPGLSFDSRGQAELRGKYRIFSTAAGREADFSGTMKLLPTRVDYKSPGLSFDSSISGELNAAGSASDIEFSGLLRFNKAAVSREDIKIRGLSLQLPLRGNRLAIKSGLFKGTMESFILTTGAQSVAVESVDFEGTGSFDVGSMSLSVNSLDVRALSLPALHMEARVGLEPGREKQAKLQATGIDITQLRSLLASFYPKRLSDWKFEGRGSLDLEVQLSPFENKVWNVLGELNLSEVLFQDPSFILAGEALRPKIAWKGEYSTKPEQVEFSLSFSLDQGESLWKEMYVSWSENPIRGDMSGVFRVPQKELEIYSLEANFSPYGSTAVTGTLKLEEPYSLNLKGSAHLSLGALDSGFLGLRPRGQESLRMMGHAQTEFQLTAKGKSLEASGELLIQEGMLENQTSHFAIREIEARIPFDFETGSGEIREESALSSKKGYFLARTLETPYFEIRPFLLNISSRKNKLLIEPFSIQLFGGTAAFGKSLFSFDPARFDFRGIFPLSLERLDISQFPIKSKQFNLKGTVQANFSQVELNPDIISTQGAGEVDIFDGKALMENIRIFSPFSKKRTLSMDITFENFSLEKLTDSIPFGRVTGILKGEIKDLAISYGQPESFTLRLESVKRKGVSQLFSLKAVNDLTVLSTGEKSGPSTLKGIARILPNFRYGKIGISSSLENDMFVLRGTIREDRTEYLVKRSGLTGISVINRMPDKKISFKDMVNRLKRIGKSSESK